MEKFNVELLNSFSDEELLEMIEHYSDRYHNHSESLISDYEFDTLTLTYEARGNDTPIGNKVVGGFPKGTHTSKMYSLKDLHSASEVVSFFGNNIKEILSFLKFDGLAIELNYVNGKLKSLITRGDGIEGYDVTCNKDLIANLVEELKDNITTSLYGEIVVHKEDFENINILQRANGEEEFKNMRNYASGSMRLIDVEKKRGRKLHVYIYKTSLTKGTLEDEFEHIRKLGIKQDLWFQPLDHFEDDLRALEEFKDDFEFPIDGVVFKVKNLELYNSLGFSESYPKGACAFKFNPNTAESVVTDIIFSVGTSGIITPVVKFEKTELDGSEVEKASIYNKSHVDKYKIAIGDRIIFHKGGEIIPEVIGIAQKSDNKPVEFPTNCPKCGSKLIYKNKLTLCNNYDCSARILGKFKKFVGKKGFNIMQLGDETLKQLLKAGVRDFADLFKLSIETFLNLDGYSEISSYKVINNIQKSKHIKLSKFIYALSLPHVSEVMASKIANYYGNLNDFLITNLKEFLKVDRIGTTTGPEILEYLRKETTIKTIKDLLDQNIVIKNPVLGIFKGIKFCITGKLSKSRDEFQKEIEEEGGEFSNNLTKSTTYLIAGEGGGSKASSAAKYPELKIISENGYNNIKKRLLKESRIEVSKKIIGD